MDIQWYPGHMAKAKRMMQENIGLVDIVAELLDARIPLSSRNPDIDKLAANKKRLIILNKFDLADSERTKLWTEYFSRKGFVVICADSKNGRGIKDFYPMCRELMREKIERQRQRGRILVPSRVMIAGIPNVGKSTLINRLFGKNMTKTGDRPGVTKNKQWVRIRKDLELLDTPGILWPKFDDPEAGVKLAVTGAINDEIVDKRELAFSLIGYLKENYPGSLEKRYDISIETDDGDADILDKICRKRGFFSKGGEPDLPRTAIVLLDEFRGGKLGSITLEEPDR